MDKQILWRIPPMLATAHAFPSGTKADAATYCGRYTVLRVHYTEPDRDTPRCEECVRRVGGAQQ